MTYVVAVDPGKMTGFWWYNRQQPLSPGNCGGGQLEQWAFIDWFERHWAEVARNDFTVVCETFQVTARSLTQRGDRLWSVEQIGILQHLSRQYGFTYLEQSPSDAKSFCSDDKLRAIGWYIKGMEHSRDAARHALLYAVRQRLIDPAALI